MNEELDLEIVELGDAKEETKGFDNLPLIEDHPTHHTRQAD